MVYKVLIDDRSRFYQTIMFYLRNKVSYLDVYQDIITGWSRDQIPLGFMED